MTNPFLAVLVAFSSFATAALTSDEPLTSDKIFPSISLFMLLQFPLAMFSQVTSNIIEALVSINRLSAFFAADELQPDAREVVRTERRLEVGDGVRTFITPAEVNRTSTLVNL